MPRTLTAQDIEDFRERLVDAATALFAKKGPDAVSMRELAAALDVSPMTPYRYFDDKEAILAAVRARAFDQFAEVMEDAYRKADGNPVEKSRAVGQAYMDFAFGNPQGYRLMFDTAQDSEGRYPELTRAAERARKTMTAHLGPLIDQGVFEGNPELIGHVFWALLHGAIELKLAGKLDSETCDFETIVGDAFRALTRGYAPGKSDATG